MKKTIFHFRTKNTKEAAATEKEERGEEEEEEEKDEKEGEEVEILAGLAKSALGTHVPRTRNWLRCHCAADSLHGYDGRRRTTTEAALPYWPSHNVVVFCTFRAARDELRMQGERERERGGRGTDSAGNNDMATIFYARATSSRCAASFSRSPSPSPSLLFFMSNYNCFG